MKYKEIDLAPDGRLLKVEEFALQFVKDVFDIDAVLLTDESSMYDFDAELPEEGNEVIHHTDEYKKKVECLYGVDISDIDGLKIVDIVERILEKQRGGDSVGN